MHHRLVPIEDGIVRRRHSETGLAAWNPAARLSPAVSREGKFGPNASNDAAA